MPEETPVTPAVEKQTYSYQAKDKQGNPVGNPQIFYYTDQADLIQQITDANQNATCRIHELKEQVAKAEKAAPRGEYKPRELTADERFQSTVDLQDPTHAQKALRQMVEAEFGAPIDEVRANLKRARDIDEKLLAQNWALNNESKGYHICHDNAVAMATYIMQNNLALTEANLDLAFEVLKETLVPRPSDTQAAQIPETQSREAIPSETRSKPQTASTGIIPGQFGGNRRPTAKAPSLSTERYKAIDRMTRQDWLKLQKHSPQEAELFLKMKHPQPA